MSDIINLGRQMNLPSIASMMTGGYSSKSCVRLSLVQMATTQRIFVVDKFGVIRVVDFDGENARVVHTYGDRGDPIICSCVNDRQLVGIAKRNGLIEIKNPMDPDVNVSFPHQLISLRTADCIGVMYLFNQSSQSCRFLTCTTEGGVTLGTVELQIGSMPANVKSWKLIQNFKGEISFGDVDVDEAACVFGGSDNLIMLDLVNKNTLNFLPPKKSSPSSFTCVSFFSNSRKIAAGTNNHEVWIYDRHQARPKLVFTFDMYPIKAVASDPKFKNLIYVGNGCGTVASIDTQKRENKDKGQRYVVNDRNPPGSIRSIARHSNFVASCGWDRYLRIWDFNSGEHLFEVDLGEHSSMVVFEKAENPAPESSVKKRKRKRKKNKKSKGKGKGKTTTESSVEKGKKKKSKGEEATTKVSSDSNSEVDLGEHSSMVVFEKAENPVNMLFNEEPESSVKKKKKSKGKPTTEGEDEMRDAEADFKSEKRKSESDDASVSKGAESRVKKSKKKMSKGEEATTEVTDVGGDFKYGKQNDKKIKKRKWEPDAYVSEAGNPESVKKNQKKCKVEPKQVREDENDVDNTTSKKEKKSKVVSEDASASSKGKKEKAKDVEV